MSEPLESVREQWRAVLGTKVADRDANFFELGGDSVMALSLIERMEKELNVTLPLEEFFASPTLGDLDDMCRAAVSGA
jgi:acyl carrier protein